MAIKVKTANIVNIDVELTESEMNGPNHDVTMINTKSVRFAMPTAESTIVS